MLTFQTLSVRHQNISDKDDIMKISVMTKVFLVTLNDFKPDNNCRNCDVFVVTEVSKLMLPGKWLTIERFCSKIQQCTR